MECNLGSEKLCVLIANGKSQAGYNPSVNYADTSLAGKAKTEINPQDEHEED